MKEVEKTYSLLPKKTIHIRDEIKITNLGEYPITIEYHPPYPFWEGGPISGPSYRITNNMHGDVLVNDKKIEDFRLWSWGYFVRDHSGEGWHGCAWG